MKEEREGWHGGEEGEEEGEERKEGLLVRKGQK